MRLLLTTIQNDCIHTKLSMKYLYSVVEEAPCQTDVVEYESTDHVGYIFRKSFGANTILYISIAI